jgi:hypothetical protein
VRGAAVDQVAAGADGVNAGKHHSKAAELVVNAGRVSA